LAGHLQAELSIINPSILHASIHRSSTHQGSFLDYDWSDGDLVFANSTCFDDFLMGSLSDMVGGSMD
jgi:hypothetical protein